MVHAIGMKRARDKDTGAWLWHSKDAGRLYDCDTTRYYFCATCDHEGRDPYIGNSGSNVTMTFHNKPPEPDDNPKGRDE